MFQGEAPIFVLFLGTIKLKLNYRLCVLVAIKRNIVPSLPWLSAKYCLRGLNSD